MGPFRKYSKSEQAFKYWALFIRLEFGVATGLGFPFPKRKAAHLIGPKPLKMLLKAHWLVSEVLLIITAYYFDTHETREELQALGFRGASCTTKAVYPLDVGFQHSL